MPRITIGGLSVRVVFSKTEREQADASCIMLSLMGFNKDASGLIFLKPVKDKIECEGIIAPLTEYFEENLIKIDADKQVQALIALINKKAAQRVAVFNNKQPKVSWKYNTPKEFKRSLLHYQIPVVEKMISVPNPANFSVPGSGKTTITYAVFSFLKKKNAVEKLFVVCPKTAFQPWEEEYEYCFRVPAESKILRIDGVAALRENLLLKEATAYDILIISYSTLINDLELVKKMIGNYKTMLVLDESHKIKNFVGITANACLSIAPYAIKRMILTGTPVTNKVSDLWTQITFLWPDKCILGAPLSYEGRLSRSDGLSWLKSTLKPIYSRIKKSDLGLPKPVIRKMQVKMRVKQKKIYRHIHGKILDKLANTEEKLLTIEWKRAQLIRLMQAASNPGLLLEKSEEFGIPKLREEPNFIELVKSYSKYETPPKVDMALTIARKLADKGEKSIIWTNYINNVIALKKHLSDLNAVEVFGGIPLKATEGVLVSREKNLLKFKTDPDVKVLVANPAACAESISLHKACQNAIYLDRTYNAGHFLQSMDRIHRIGLPKNAKVTYHIIILEDSIDERIDCRLKQKVELLEKIMEDEFKPLELDFTGEADDEKLINSFGVNSELGLDFEDLIKNGRQKYAKTFR